MNVVIAAAAAKGERQKMSTNNAETKESVPVSGEPPRKANTRAQNPVSRPPRGRRGSRQEGPQSTQSRQTLEDQNREFERFILGAEQNAEYDGSAK